MRRMLFLAFLSLGIGVAGCQRDAAAPLGGLPVRPHFDLSCKYEDPALCTKLKAGIDYLKTNSNSDCRNLGYLADELYFNTTETDPYLLSVNGYGTYAPNDTTGIGATIVYVERSGVVIDLKFGDTQFKNEFFQGGPGEGASLYPTGGTQYEETKAQKIAEEMYHRMGFGDFDGSFPSHADVKSWAYACR